MEGNRPMFNSVSLRRNDSTARGRPERLGNGIDLLGVRRRLNA
jgi:hypothetical protein